MGDEGTSDVGAALTSVETSGAMWQKGGRPMLHHEGVEELGGWELLSSPTQLPHTQTHTHTHTFEKGRVKE